MNRWIGSALLLGVATPFSLAPGRSPPRPRPSRRLPSKSPIRSTHRSVQCVATMLDASIPLTTCEYDEWGNRANQASHDDMLGYSPTTS